MEYQLIIGGDVKMRRTRVLIHALVSSLFASFSMMATAEELDSKAGARRASDLPIRPFTLDEPLKQASR